jgi:hypothetical protein
MASHRRSEQEAAQERLRQEGNNARNLVQW